METKFHLHLLKVYFYTCCKNCCNAIIYIVTIMNTCYVSIENLTLRHRCWLWSYWILGSYWSRRVGLQRDGGGASSLEWHAGQPTQTYRPMAHAAGSAWEGGLAVLATPPPSGGGEEGGGSGNGIIFNWAISLVQWRAAFNVLHVLVDMQVIRCCSSVWLLINSVCL